MGKRLALVLICAIALLLLVVPVAAAGISIQFISPAAASANKTVTTSITGSFKAPLGEYVAAPVFTLVRGSTRITGTTTDVTSGGALVDFVLPASTPAGIYRLEASQQWTPVQAPWRRANAATGKGFTLTETASLADAFYVYHTPVIISATPLQVPQGSGDTTLTVLGTDFVQSSEESAGSRLTLWPVGQPGSAEIRLPSTCQSSGQVTGIVPAQAMVTAGEYFVRVYNPGDPQYGIPEIGSELVESSLRIAVTGVPRPVIFDLAPRHYAWAGYSGHVKLDVGATGILPTARLFFDDAERPAAYTAIPDDPRYLPGVLSTTLTPADLATARKIKVQVANLPELMSGAEYFDVKPETTTPVPAIFPPGAADTVYNTPVRVEVSASDDQSGLKRIEYRCPPLVDDWRAVAAFDTVARRAGERFSFTVPLGEIGLNTYTVEVRATDWCGHAGTASQQIQMKRIRPVTLPLANVTGKLGTWVKLPYRVRESAAISPTVDVTVVVYRATGHIVKSISIKAVPVNSDRIANLKLAAPLFKAGNYYWKVFATDQYGTSQLKPVAKQLTVTAP